MTRTKAVIGAVVIIVVLSVLVLLMHPSSNNSYNPTILFVCVATIAVSLLLYIIIRHILLPKRTFSIETDISLKSSPIPLFGRDSFHVTVTVRELKKGESSVVSQRRVEVKFRKKDHPQFVADCLRLIGEVIADEKQAALKLAPKARVRISNSYLSTVKALAAGEVGPQAG